MQIGAIDYLLKPVEPSRLESAVRRGLEMRAMRSDVQQLRHSLLHGAVQCKEAFAHIVTQSPAMLSVFRYVEAVARSSHPVLITGETGTGKDLIAQAVHQLSGRPGELVAVDIAGVDDAFFLSTLFGHARGAFTGADRARAGLVATTGQGTLFLDEIGDLAMASQKKLLRLLQDGSYYAMGSDRPARSQARVIVATNRDVRHDMQEGRFRNDLYYRLSTHHVPLPPLRARADDIPLLAHHFVAEAARASGKPAPTVPESLLQLLRGYSWPGNVRELKKMCDDAVSIHQGRLLSADSFRASMGSLAVPAAAAGERSGLDFPDPLPTLESMQQALVAEALRRVDGNQTVAAAMLGLSRQALNKRLARRRHDEIDRGPQD
jgi:DNA-binding NtrC family response regulator